MSVYFEFEKRLHFLWIVEDINGRGTFYVNRRLKRIYKVAIYRSGIWILHVR